VAIAFLLLVFVEGLLWSGEAKELWLAFGAGGSAQAAALIDCWPSGKQNLKGERFIESHFSQRRREVGHL
jgi:hypothetical protein